jgi:hypothetical protein
MEFTRRNSRIEHVSLVSLIVSHFWVTERRSSADEGSEPRAAKQGERAKPRLTAAEG